VRVEEQQRKKSSERAQLEPGYGVEEREGVNTRFRTRGEGSDYINHCHAPLSASLQPGWAELQSVTDPGCDQVAIHPPGSVNLGRQRIEFILGTTQCSEITITQRKPDSNNPLSHPCIQFVGRLSVGGRFGLSGPRLGSICITSVVNVKYPNSGTCPDLPSHLVALEMALEA
jgi:hypothetical protein